MKSAFMKMLMSSRRRPNESLQERVAQYSMYPPHRNVQAAPQKPPVREGKRRG